MVLLSMNPSYDSPRSSPPTPPSPLPISFGPGNRKYSFSASSASPPFSPETSSHNSAENEKLPLLQEHLTTPNVPSVFSLDRQNSQELEHKSTCLKDLIEWFIQRCCNCCTRFIEFSQRDMASHSQ